jgi:aspartate/methionine/tyrosine aminotransferase
MSFHENDYLHWYMPRLRDDSGAINLHSSGVVSLSPADVQVPVHEPWTVVERFEAELAGWLSLPAGEVLFTPGATGGTLLALLALAGRDDEIAVERPVYEPMLRQAHRVGRVRRFDRSPSAGWSFDVDAAAASFTDATRVVMITEPCNPSGTFADRADVLALADAAAARGAVLLVNEIYLGYTDRPSLHRQRENIVVVSSLSKLLGTYWMRLGWLSASASTIALLRSAHMNLTMPTRPAAAFGLGVLARAGELRERAVTLASTGRATVDDWVRSTGGVIWTPPEGPGFGCVMLPPSAGGDVELAERAHSEHGVLAVPGSFFGVPSSLRLSWLQDRERLEEGLQRLSRALSS